MSRVRQRATSLLLRVLRLAALSLLGVLLVLGGCQDYLLFPGRTSQGRAPLVPGAGDSPIRLSLSDGTPVAGLFSPHRDGSRDRPTMLFFYGNGMSGADAMGFADWFKEELGVNFAVFDYPGYGDSGGSPSERSIYALADVAYDHLASRADLDPHRLLITGLSLGGGPATHAAARSFRDGFPGPPAAGLVLFSAFTSVGDAAAELLPYVPGVRALVRHKFDNLANIAGVRCPVFLGHGRRDNTVNFTMQARLADAVTRSGGGPVTIFTSDAGHNDFFETESGRLMAELRGFLDAIP